MADLSSYKKSTVVINTLISATLLFVLMWLCVYASLHCDLFNLEVGGVVIAAFAVMPYLILGGLYGYFVSLISFLIMFIYVLIADSDNVYKMSINLAVLLCFSLAGQYRMFSTWIKTAITAAATLLITTFMQFFTIVVVDGKQYTLDAYPLFMKYFFRGIVVAFLTAFLLHFYFTKAPDNLKYPFPVSVTYTSFYYSDIELQTGFKKTKVSIKITAIIILLEIILGIFVAIFMIALFPDIKSIMISNIERGELLGKLSGTVSEAEIQEDINNFVFTLDATTLSYDIKMLLLMLCVGVPIAGIANFYTKVAIGAPLGRMSDFMREYADADDDSKLIVGRKVENLNVKSHDEIKVVNDSIKKTVYAIEKYICHINEEHELEKELEIAKKSSESKSSFLSNMSHEIRTPINAILGMDEMILRESNQEEILNYAENIRSAGNNLLGIVNDILDFSKIEAGKLEIVPVEYAVSSVLNDLVNMIKKRAEDKGLELKVKIDPEIPNILYGDEIRIKQVITNILTNAVKYTKEGSVTLDIHIKERKDDDIVINVSVADTGIGIKEEEMPKLFSAFERIDERHNRTVEGSGLGMSITQDLLDMMNSKLEVESIYGKGSTFTFDLEQKIVDETPIGDFDQALKRSIASRNKYRESFIAPDARILVVDDTKMNLTVIEGLLKKTQLQIDTATSGRECLELLHKNKYDMIFLDHRMPEMDGIQTFRIIKKHELIDKEKTQVIALTANAVSGSRDLYMAEGFDDYISKPIDPILLEVVILKFLLPKGLAIVTDDNDSKEKDPKAKQTSKKSTSGKENIEKEEYGSFDPDSQVPKWIRNISGIDVNKGLYNCGSPTGYEDALRLYEEGADESISIIENAFETSDYDNFTIKVHAIKSSSRIIGAGKLGTLAEELEKAGNDQNDDIIKSKTPVLLKEYIELVDSIRRADPKRDGQEEGGKAKEPISFDQLKEAYDAMTEIAQMYDYDSMIMVLNQIDEYELPKEQETIYKKLKEAIHKADWNEINVGLKQALKVLSGSN